MVEYKSKNGDSGVIAYEFGDDYIVLKFKKTKRYSIYKYTNSSAGERAIKAMKNLALASAGLTTYINQNNPRYIQRWN